MIHMVESVLLLIIIGCVLSSIFEFKKLLLSLRQSNDIDLTRFVAQDAVANYIKSMDSAMLREFSIRYFDAYGYPADSSYQGILTLKGWRYDSYIKYISSAGGKKVEISDAAELLGYMVHDRIKGGIIITNSEFDKTVLSFCRQSGIEIVGPDEILHRIADMDEGNASSFIPGTG